MQMRLWQMSHITGIWNPTGVLHDPVLQIEPAIIPEEIAADQSKEIVWVPDGFAPPGWEDLKFQTFLAFILNDKMIFGDGQYCFSYSAAMQELKGGFPDGAAIWMDEKTDVANNGPLNDMKCLRLVTQAEGAEKMQEKQSMGLGEGAR